MSIDDLVSGCCTGMLDSVVQGDAERCTLAAARCTNMVRCSGFVASGWSIDVCTRMYMLRRALQHSGEG